MAFLETPSLSDINSIYVIDATFATARDATTGTTREFYHSQASKTVNYQVERVFLTYDTSSLPVGSITSARLKVYIDAVTNDDTPSYRLYTSSHTNPTSGDDYNDMTTTEASDTYLTNPSTGGYTNFELNAAGIAAINGSGDTKLCLREATYDLGNSAPAGTNSIKYAENDQSNLPILEVNIAGSGGDDAPFLAFFD